MRDAFHHRRRETRMVKETAVPQDVLSALDAYPHVKRVWEASSDEHRDAWLQYIEEADTPAHRERRIDIMIAGLRP